MYASDHRANARDALRGNWGVAVLVCFLASLISGAGTNVSINYEDGQPVQVHLPESLQLILEDYLGVAVSVIFLIAAVLLVAGLILGGVMQLGKARYFLNLMDRKEAQVGDLFGSFHRFLPAMIMNLLSGAATFLGMMLLVVPGILATYGLALAPYILQEDPECTATEALSRSWNMMKGHKWELFCLEISFIGWGILSAFTLGIGGLFLAPYTEAAKASFYRSLQNQGYATVE